VGEQQKNSTYKSHLMGGKLADNRKISILLFIKRLSMRTASLCIRGTYEELYKTRNFKNHSFRSERI